MIDKTLDQGEKKIETLQQGGEGRK